MKFVFIGKSFLYYMIKGLSRDMKQYLIEWYLYYDKNGQYIESSVDIGRKLRRLLGLTNHRLWNEYQTIRALERRGLLCTLHLYSGTCTDRGETLTKLLILLTVNKRRITNIFPKGVLILWEQV